MSSVYKPIISGTLLSVLMWIFIILAIVGFLWYAFYVTASKTKTVKGQIFGGISIALVVAITIQLIFLSSQVYL